MKIGKRAFRPEAIPTIVMILAVALLSGLGFWQLHRAEEKNALAGIVAARTRLAPLDLNAIESVDVRPDSITWRRATMKGTWDSSRQILLDNQVMDGESGYFVYTILRANDAAVGVLFNRGWIRAGDARSTVPDVSVEAKSASVSGVITPPPRVGLNLSEGGNRELLAPGVSRVQTIDIQSLSQQFGIRLQPFAVSLDLAAQDGYRRTWRTPTAGADRNTAYAMQWFLLAVVTLAVYVALGLNRAQASI